MKRTSPRNQLYVWFSRGDLAGSDQPDQSRDRQKMSITGST